MFAAKPQTIPFEQLVAMMTSNNSFYIKPYELLSNGHTEMHVTKGNQTVNSVLGIDPKQQMDPQELFQIFVGEHLPHWQIMFGIPLQEHGAYVWKFVLS